MGEHPAQCHCADEDPRLIECVVCGHLHVNTPRGCPHCRYMREEYLVLRRQVKHVRELVTKLVEAHVNSDAACEHNCIVDIQRELEL